MAEKKNLPEIRFKGFREEWKMQKLAKVAEFNPKADLPEIFEYVDLESVAGTEMIAHKKERKDTAPSRAQRLAQQGDLFYQTVRPYQKNNYLFEKNCKNYVFSTGYAQMRPNGDGYFLLSLVQNNGFVKTVLDNCTGTSYPAINSNNLAELEVSIPTNNNEQSQIGTYFKHLDHLITIHQSKYDKLVNVKKAMLEKMFPKKGDDVPEIRFKGFSGDWKEKKLDLIADVRDGTHNSPKYYTEGHPFVTSKNVKEGKVNYDDIQYIADVDYEEINKRSKVDKNDILMGMIGTIGNIALVSETPNFAIKNVALIKDTKSIYYLYLYHYLCSPIVSRQLEEGMDGGTQKFIALNKIRNLSIAVPKKNTEQSKIGTFFKHLDHLLSLQQQELEKLKNIKKACLEKMFV